MELRAGRELQVATTECFHKIVDGVVVARNVGKEFGIVGIAWDAGRVAEQLADGDFRTGVLAIIGEIVGGARRA